MAMPCSLRWGLTKFEPVRRKFGVKGMVEEHGMKRQEIIDMHLHVWASKEEVRKYPYFPGQEPTTEGHPELLLQRMSEAGVAGALIVQPINYKFDHSYVSSVIQKYPGKFVGCCLANPDSDGNGLAELERLVTQEGYKAVRFNPYLWPTGQKMNNDLGKEMFGRAGELNVPVGIMCFKGLSLHIEEIESLCSSHPSTTVLIDHFGFCKPPVSQVEKDAWDSLLSLARHPQVYVKISAFFRVSREPFPYKDTWPLLQQLVHSYGSSRLLWGSDFPFVNDECGYYNSSRVLHAAMDNGFISEDDLIWLLGKSARKVFNHGWNVST